MGLIEPPSFPPARIDAPERFLDAYAGELGRALGGIDRTAFARAAALLHDAIRRGALVMACGNGGSAALANHLLCDFAKGVRADTDLAPRVVSLSSPVELMTAVANDIDYAEVFVHQMRALARPGDVLVAISSSGESENIVRALDWACGNGLATLALTGFSGGRAARLADVHLHVAARNYGIVEDLHQGLLHALAQYLRQAAMPAALVAARRF